MYQKEKEKMAPFLYLSGPAIWQCTGDREELLCWKKDIADKLSRIGFLLNEGKCEVVEMKTGFMFLGFHYRMTESGKIIMMLDLDKVKAERRKLKKLVGLSKKGRLSREKVEQCYQSWQAHASKGNTHNLIIRMDEYFASLWR